MYTSLMGRATSNEKVLFDEIPDSALGQPSEQNSTDSARADRQVALTHQQVTTEIGNNNMTSQGRIPEPDPDTAKQRDFKTAVAVAVDQARDNICPMAISAM